MKAFGLLLFSALLLVSSQHAFKIGTKYETQLFDTIFKDYDKRIRPVEDCLLPVVVNFSITFHQILKVDEKNQVITSNILRTIYWQDVSFKWNPENFGNITQISVLRSEIWTPDVYLYNSAAFDEQVGSQTKNVILKDGLVIDVLPMLMKSTCKIDVTWFPFDEQKCFLIFGSWDLPAKYLLLQSKDYATDNVYGFIQSEEWKIQRITVHTTNNTYPCCPDDEYIKITYTIHFKRRTFYYFFNLLVPCGLIGFLAVLGFTLPPDSGEKLPLGATILFSLIVFLNTIGESMPANSDAVPLLGTYFNCVMFMIALSVVSTIVINLNLKAIHLREVQGRSRKIFLSWLPWILRMNSPVYLITQQDKFMSRKNKVGDDTIALHLNHSAANDSKVAYGLSPDNIASQEWKFVAILIDRLCLLFSLIFTFSSVVVFLIYAY